MTIIDLAGSEKGSNDKQSSYLFKFSSKYSLLIYEGKGILEGSSINKSLLALGNCINILSEKKKAG